MYLFSVCLIYALILFRSFYLFLKKLNIIIKNKNCSLEKIELGVRTQRLDVNTNRVGKRAAETVDRLVSCRLVHIDLVSRPL